MKKLQNNFTTLEQSKRLLELGVPADSADCYYTNMRATIWVGNETDRIDWEAKVGDIPFYTPCWSVGQLIEIYLTCAKEYHPYDDFYTETPSVHFDVYSKEMLVEEIINSIEVDDMDFSKLED